MVAPLEHALPPEHATPSKSSKNTAIPPLGCSGNLTLSTVYSRSSRSESPLKTTAGKRVFQTVRHPLFHASNMRFVVAHVLVSMGKRPVQPNDACHVLCAPAQHTLLASAHDHPIDAQLGVDVEKPDPFGPQFVRTAGEKIDVDFAEVQTVVPHGLNRIAVQQGPVAAAQCADGLKVQHDPNFVVGVHQRDKRFLLGLGQLGFQIFQIHPPIDMVADMGHLHTPLPFGGLCGPDDGAVFRGRRDDAGDTQALNSRLDRVVVGLCPPDVKQMVRDGTPNSPAMLRRLVSTNALAFLPGACVEDGLPWTERYTSTMASTTSGATGVVAALSKYACAIRTES